MKEKNLIPTTNAFGNYNGDLVELVGNIDKLEEMIKERLGALLIYIHKAGFNENVDNFDSLSEALRTKPISTIRVEVKSDISAGKFLGNQSQALIYFEATDCKRMGRKLDQIYYPGTQFTFDNMYAWYAYLYKDD